MWRSSSLIWCLNELDLLSWIFLSYSISLFLALSILSVWDLMRVLYSSYLACHLLRLSFASLLKFCSHFYKWLIFWLLDWISCSFSWIVYLSSAIKLSFSAFSSSKPLILDYNCLTLSYWIFLTSSSSYE